MPYANFDDLNSVRAVYNNYLQEDNDSNIFEFIGEKILTAGFIHDEGSGLENLPVKQHHPSNATVQIQTGVLFQPPFREDTPPIFPEISISYTLTNTIFLFRDFRSRVFHPPFSLI
jgi:hypothetical protein